MRVIGLTGGIGSGKSTVAGIFESLDIPVFYADQAGRVLLDENTEVQQKVRKLLGDDSYTNNKANRKHIAQKVFGNDDLLNQLNAIIHPAVKQNFEEWKASQSKSAKYCLREAAILFESGSNQDCDRVICVFSNDELRIERVMKRDGVSRDSVLGRMAKQWPQQKLADLSDFVIHNDTEHSLIQQVLSIHQKLLKD